jgi:hypothetical protein
LMTIQGKNCTPSCLPMPETTAWTRYRKFSFINKIQFSGISFYSFKRSLFSDFFLC